MKHPLWPCAGALVAALTGAVGLTMMAPTSAASESRALAPFERVAFDAPGELLITQGSSESVDVEAEARVLPLLRTRVESGTLVIGVVGSLQTRQPIRVRVTLRTLALLHVDGAAEVQIGALRTPALTLQLAGSSRARVAELDTDRFELQLEGSSELQVLGGRVRHQDVRIDDAASYDAAGLISDDVQVAIRGSGQARLHAARRLEAQVADSGLLAYAGAARVTRRLSDAARMDRLEKP